MINALTIDVEDYFHVSAFERYIDKKNWDNLPSRVEINTNKILEILDENNVKATFFILGWVAERYPSLVNRIAQRGHELACHGSSHIRVINQSPKEFRVDVVKSKELIEDISGTQIRGYRAASYSIGISTLWAFEILEEIGFDYSSSIYPIHHDLYGMPEAPRFIFKPENAKHLIEIPITTVTIANNKFPCGGGGYFRLYPYMFSKWAINKVNNVDRKPCVFYFHPWEIDPNQPRQIGLDYKTNIRHYLNLSCMEKRIRKLLNDFSWSTIDAVFLNK